MKLVTVFKAFVSIWLGGAIYLAFRSPSLVMFQWAETLGAVNFLAGLRSGVAPLGLLAPNWIVFSLPQGLWVYSGLLALCSIWGTTITLASRLWLGGVAMLGLSIEPLQALELLPGTFDMVDFVFVIAAVAAAYLEKGNLICEDQGGNTPPLCLS